MCKNTFPIRRASWQNYAKPRGPVRKNIIRSAVAASTVKRGFVMPKFLGLVHVRASSYGLRGMVGATRKDVRTTDLVFLTTMLHPLRVRTQTVVPQSRSGAKAMTAISQASRSAAPQNRHDVGIADPIQLHADAHNALNMAVFYLRQPEANTVAARRKAIQALAALRSLSLALEG